MHEKSKSIPDRIGQRLPEDSNLHAPVEGDVSPVTDGREGDLPSDISSPLSDTDAQLLGGLASGVITTELSEQVEDNPDLRRPVATPPIPCGLPVVPPAPKRQPDSSTD